MHSKLIRLIVLFAILICLPLQGLAAVTMPSCQMHGSKVEMQVDTDQSDGMSHCDHHDANQLTKKAPCDKCLSCYLSVAQAIIPFSIFVELNSATPMFTGLIAETPDSILSSLFHPPRPISA